MNAGGVSNTCKSSASSDERRTAEEHVGSCLELRDSPLKSGLIPDSPARVKIYRFERRLRPITLVGEVTAHQG